MAEQVERSREKAFHVSVGDEAMLTVSEIWPDGDAPENPTADDVIEQIKRSSSKYAFARDWGFDTFVEVNGKPVDW